MKPEKKKRGPVEERLKIDEPDWEQAMKRALQKGRPAEGWPKPEKPTKPKKDAPEQ